MEDDPSYIDAGAKRCVSYIPISMWNWDNNMLMRIRRECDSLKDCERDLENKIDALHSEVKDLETSLQAQSKTPSYTAVTKPQWAPQAQAKHAPTVSKPLFVLKVSDTSKTVVPPTPKDLKGKATTAVPTMDYGSALLFDNDKYGSDYDTIEDAAEEAKATTSKMAELVSAILNGNVPTHAVGPSGSNSVEGRVPDLRPALNAEFQLALRALEQAHAKSNVHKGNLLLSIRQYISACHRTNTASRMAVQRLSLNQWRAPSWAKKLKYDPGTGMVKPMGVTKEENWNQRAQEDRPTKQARLLLSISNHLGLTVNDVPNPHLGNISSPRHEDHPLMWMEWATKVTHIMPKGISLTHNGYPYEWVIRGFRRLTPLFKEKKKEKGNAKASPEDVERRT
jgi:hypothetical protein